MSNLSQNKKINKAHFDGYAAMLGVTKKDILNDANWFNYFEDFNPVRPVSNLFTSIIMETKMIGVTTYV